MRDAPDDVRAALAAWESGLRPSIVRHQRLAHLKQQMFVPSSRWAETMRSFVLRLGGAVRRSSIERQQ
jgi:hypothetical protein